MKLQNKRYLGTDNLVETWYPYNSIIIIIINIIISKTFELCWLQMNIRTEMYGKQKHEKQILSIKLVYSTNAQYWSIQSWQTELFQC